MLVINLVLFFNNDNDPDAGTACHMQHLIQFLQGQPGMDITCIRTDDPASKTVTCRKTGNVATLAIPQPANNVLLSAHHTTDQMMYAGRMADILYPYLQTKNNLIFLANSVDYVRVFEVLKERYDSAKFMYVHRAWSWKRYLTLPDDLFFEYWRKADVSSAPKAFELTAYEQRMALLAHKTVTLSNQAANIFTQFLNIPPQKITLIRNGVAHAPDAQYDPDELRKSFGFSTDEKIILFAGNITRPGGIFYLLQAFKHLLTENENSRLLIAGEGDYSSLLALIRPHWGKVTFTGTGTVEELNKLVALSNAGVVPSLYGQCSMAALHMRWGQLPMIVSAIDGLDECFEDEIDSLKINIERNEKNEPVIDVNQLQAKITRLLNDKKLAGMLAENSYKRATEQFSLHKMCNSYLQLLMQVASS